MTNFKIVVQDCFPSQATNLSSHTEIANRILKEKLMERQLDMFKRIVFGRYMDMDIVFNSPLVHRILLKEVKTNNNDVMSFEDQ